VAETIGSLMDKISIVELKIFHMREQEQRPGASGEFRVECLKKIKALTEQSVELSRELDGLKPNPPKPFPQFKMYNDPQYQEK
jgi:hypothetical protein